MPASSTQAFPHLLHDVYEHVGVPPFCDCARDHGKNVHDVRHICDHRVCGHGCDPQCISRIEYVFVYITLSEKFMIGR